MNRPMDRPDSFAQSFPARRDALPDVRMFIEDACDRARVGRKDCLRLTLLLEELFTNTVNHGYGRDTDEPVRIGIDVSQRTASVSYEDAAPPFDPFQSVASPSDDTPVEDRPVGGLGIVLLTKMTQRCGYAYTGGKNCITFEMAVTS